jgi:hypothetical protein
MLILFALGSAFAVLATAPTLSDWSGSAIGALCSEAPGALWRLWSNSQSLAPVGFPAAAPDALSGAPIMALGFQFLLLILGSAAAAWNTLIALGFGVLITGTIALAKRIAPDAPLLAHITFVIAVVGASAWSPLVQQVGVGMIPMMCVPGVLALIHAWLDPHAPRWTGGAAMLFFLIAVLGHWAATVFVIAMTLPMVIVLTRHWEGPYARNKVLISIGPGIIVGCWYIYQTCSAIPGLELGAALLSPAWIHQAKGALVLPATAAVALPSLGILILALTGVAARPRDTAGWLLSATWGVLLAAGASPLSAKAILPAQHMAEAIPGLEFLGSWWAIAPLVSIPFGVAAMRGVQALHKVQRDPLAMGILILAIVDQTLPSMVATGPQKITPSLGEATVTALSNLPPGGVLQLPATDTECGRSALHRLWQPLHGRPISTAAPGGTDGGLRVSYLARIVSWNNPKSSARASKESPLTPEEYLCAISDLTTLKELGFAAVLLDNQNGEQEASADVLRQVLGAPISDNHGIHLWAIEDAIKNKAPPPCPLLLPATQ